MRAWRSAAAVLGLSLLALGPVLGSPTDDGRRARTGIKLFRAMLAADQELAGKTLQDGRLLLVFFFAEDRASGEALASQLTADDGATGGAAVRGLEIETALTDDPTFSQLGGRSPAGIFLAERPSERDLAAIIRYGVEHGVIVYSPFEGHVESGVSGGLSIEAQVRPYVNTTTLSASHILLKPFFMKVAKVFP